MMVTGPARLAVLVLAGLMLAGLGWRGFQAYQEDQRAQLAATLAAAEPQVVSDGGKSVAMAGDGSPSTTSAGVAVAQPAPKLLVVHVEGAVQKPGVYTFEQGARVYEAIALAGGALPDGLPGALNLAAPLTDGAKVYVFTKAELTPVAAGAEPASRGATYAPVVAAAATEPPTTTGAGAGSAAVSVNTATAKELERVPGIGPAMARAIIEYRTKHGGFKRLEDLTGVTGIGPKTLEKLRPYLRL